MNVSGVQSMIVQNEEPLERRELTLIDLKLLRPET